MTREHKRKKSSRISPAPHPVALTVRFQAQTLRAMIHIYHPDVLLGGMFIRTRGAPPFQPGTPVRLKFLLWDGTVILSGAGVVAWIQRQRAGTGIGLQFLHLTPASERLYLEMLRRKSSAEELPLEAVQELRPPSEEEFAELPTWPDPPAAAGRGAAGPHPGGAI